MNNSGIHITHLYILINVNYFPGKERVFSFNDLFTLRVLISMCYAFARSDRPEVEADELYSRDTRGARASHLPILTGIDKRCRVFSLAP